MFLAGHFRPPHVNHLLFSLTCGIRRALEDLNEALKLQPNAADVMYVVATCTPRAGRAGLGVCTNLSPLGLRVVSPWMHPRPHGPHATLHCPLCCACSTVAPRRYTKGEVEIQLGMYKESFLTLRQALQLNPQVRQHDLVWMHPRPTGA